MTITRISEKNFQFIHKAQQDPSCMGRLRYQVVGRISTAGVSLLRLSEAVLRASMACLAAMTYLASLGFWSTSKTFAAQQLRQTNQAVSSGIHCFLSLFSAKGLHGHLAKAFYEQVCQFVGDYIIMTRSFITQNSAAQKNFIAEQLQIKNQHPGYLFGVFNSSNSNSFQLLKTGIKDTFTSTLANCNGDRLTNEEISKALAASLGEEFKTAGGTNASLALIYDGKLWIANAGKCIVRADKTEKLHFLAVANIVPQNSSYSSPEIYEIPKALLPPKSFLGFDRDKSYDPATVDPLYFFCVTQANQRHALYGTRQTLRDFRENIGS